MILANGRFEASAVAEKNVEQAWFALTVTTCRNVNVFRIEFWRAGQMEFIHESPNLAQVLSLLGQLADVFDDRLPK